MRSLLAFLLILVAAAAFAEPPRAVDERLEITLFAEHPTIVTPTGIDVDHAGRVWAIESNTHFPPDGYQRHDSDRLYVMKDTNGDGRADDVNVFADGFTHTMSVAVRPVWLDAVESGERRVEREVRSDDEDSQLSTLNSQPRRVFLAERSTIWLLEDLDDDLKCDRRTKLVRLETPGNYPHNGLAGFAFDAMGWMYFGFGENLGAKYTIHGSDGTKLSGGGEGGNVYRCRPDGSKLQLWATGFWNPHASCVDAFGRLFTVDNDPDSRPPCRLLHVIEGGDYGFKFRNGRKGLHPFTSWNGEVPGTLPMVAGTGEAPSGIVAYESDGLPEDYLGNLLVTSWGDHRIDRFRLEPKGASFTSVPEPIVQGDDEFRPVGLATAPDGSLFCTDWVKRDYKLHGHGRIWRISWKDRPKSSLSDNTKPTEDATDDELVEALGSERMDTRRAAATIWDERDSRASKAGRRRRHWLEFKDRFDSERVLYELVGAQKRRAGDLEHGEHFTLGSIIGREDLSDPFVLTRMATLTTKSIWVRPPTREEVDALYHARAGFGFVAKSKHFEEARLLALMIARRDFRDVEGLVREALVDPSPKVRQFAVQWAAEEKVSTLRSQVEVILGRPGVTPDLFRATIAALQMLDGVDPKEIDRTPPTQYVMSLVRDNERPANVRALALRMLGDGAGRDPKAKFDAGLAKELLASDSPELRLETVRTLQTIAEPFAAELARAIADDPEADADLRAEAVVALGTEPREADRDVLLGLLKADNDGLRREALRSLRPLVKTDEGVAQAVGAIDDAELREAVALAQGASTRGARPPLAGGDPLAGRRVFFHASGPGCAKCHTVGGRGGNVGPDLSLIARTMDRKKLAESILEPSKEVAPQFTNWTFVMTDGKVKNGMILRQTRKLFEIGTPEGERIEFPSDLVEARTPQKTSVMPTKLHERMTSQEFRDLLAYLESLK